MVCSKQETGRKAPTSVTTMTSQEDDFGEEGLQCVFSYSLRISGMKHLQRLMKQEILDNIVNISEIMDGNPNDNDLLAPDTDVESPALSGEECGHLLDDKEDGDV